MGHDSKYLKSVEDITRNSEIGELISQLHLASHHVEISIRMNDSDVDIYVWRPDAQIIEGAELFSTGGHDDPKQALEIVVKELKKRDLINPS